MHAESLWAIKIRQPTDRDLLDPLPGTFEYPLVHLTDPDLELIAGQMSGSNLVFVARHREHSDPGGIDGDHISIGQDRHRKSLGGDRSLVLETGKSDQFPLHTQSPGDVIASLNGRTITLLDGQIQVLASAARGVERHLRDLEVLPALADHSAGHCDFLVHPGRLITTLFAALENLRRIDIEDFQIIIFGDFGKGFTRLGLIHRFLISCP